MTLPVMVDLFSGLGGASQAMKDRGWTVVRVDIEERFNPDIRCDVRDARLIDLLPCPVELLWASPPYVDFSVIRRLPSRRLHRPPDMSCVRAVEEIVRVVRPRFWILENAAGLEAQFGAARQRFRWHYLWGEFPLVLSDTKSDKGAKWRIGDHGRSRHGLPGWMIPALRAKIPYQLSLAVAQTIENALRESTWAWVERLRE